MMSSSRVSDGRAAHRGLAPSSATASASLPGSRAGEQVAEPLAAGDPGGVHERGQPDLARRSRRSQVARSRLVSSRGRPVPPARARISGVVTFRRAGSVPPVTRPVPANAAEASSGSW